MRSRLAELDVYYGWFVAGACLMVSAVTFGMIFSFSVFFGHLADEFGRSYASASVIFSLQSVVTYTGAALLGIVVDRYGVRPLLIVAAALIGVGLFGASRLSSFIGVTVAYGGVAAAGFGITYVVSYITASRWFERRRGLAVGMATSGTNVGVLFFPPLASFLIAGYGWRTAYLLLMLLVVAVLIVAALLIADRPDDPDFAVDTGAEFPDGIPDHDPVSADEQLRTVAGIVTSRSFVLTFLGWLFIYTPLYVLLVYLVEYTATAGIGRGVGVFAVSVIGASAFASRYLGGLAADRWGTVSVFGVCAATLGTATLLVGLIDRPAAVVGLAVLFGIGYGGAGALLSPLITEIYGTINLGALFGFATASFAVAGSLMPYLAGVGYDAVGAFPPVFVAAGVTGIAGAILTVLVGRRALPPSDARPSE